MKTTPLELAYDADIKIEDAWKYLNLQVADRDIESAKESLEEIKNLAEHYLRLIQIAEKTEKQ